MGTIENQGLPLDRKMVSCLTKHDFVEAKHHQPQQKPRLFFGDSSCLGVLMSEFACPLSLNSVLRKKYCYCLNFNLDHLETLQPTVHTGTVTEQV